MGNCELVHAVDREGMNFEGSERLSGIVDECTSHDHWVRPREPSATKRMWVRSLPIRYLVPPAGTAGLVKRNAGFAPARGRYFWAPALSTSAT